MDHAAAPRQAKSTPRFIQQDPTSSQYSGRISADDKAKLVPLLLAVHGKGATREQMLAECNAVLGTPITFAQLDRQRAKLNLHTYRRQQPKPPSQTQRPNAIAPRSFNEEHLDSAGPGLESASINGNFANQRRHMDAQDTSQVEPRAHPSDTEILGDDHDDHNDAAPQPGSLPDLVSIDLSSSATLETLETSLQPSPRDAVPLSKGHLQKPSRSEMDGHFTPLPVLIGFRLTDPGNPDQEVSYYVQSASLARISLERLNGGATAMDIAQLVQIATLLHTLGALDQAFDGFCILFRYFYFYASVNGRQPYMCFAAIACAQTARSPLQLRVAHGMVHSVRWFDLFSCARFRVSSILAAWDRRLKDLINGREWISPRRYEEVILTTFAALGLSHSEHHIELRDTRCDSRSCLADPLHIVLDPLHIVLDEKLLGNLLLDELENALSTIGSHMHELDLLTRDAWKSFPLTAGSIAKGLACTILKEYARNDATRKVSDRDQFPGSDSFQARLKSVALALAPFVLLRATGQVENMVEFYFQAARLCQRGVLSDHSSFDLFKQFCETRLRNSDANHSYTALSLSPEEMVEICASVAGIKFPGADPTADASSSNLEKGAPSMDEERPSRRFEGLKHSFSQFPILPPAWSEVVLLEQPPLRSPILVPALRELEPLGQMSERSSVLSPALARTYSPSTSSSLRSFVSLVGRLRRKGTRLSDDGHGQDGASESGTSHSSWRLDFMSVTSSSTLSTRRSGLATLSDVEMTG